MVLSSFSANSSAVNTFLAFFFVSASNSSAFLCNTMDYRYVITQYQPNVSTLFVAATNSLAFLKPKNALLASFFPWFLIFLVALATTSSVKMGLTAISLLPAYQSMCVSMCINPTFLAYLQSA